MLGSCFIENIGKLLINNKFNVDLNPFGVLYNPVSIRQAIDILLQQKEFTNNDIFFHNGLYQSFFHHGSFSDIDKDKCLEKINTQLRHSVQSLQNTDVLFITFGTAYVYQSKEKNMVVGNCHKLPSSHFDRYRLSVDDIVKEWDDLIQRLREINPSLQVLFTISPIRHLRDGAPDNQLSKATLLLAVDKLMQSNGGVYYFPSYEVVLDELRDYRFYNEDMIHPNNVAINYIWQRFIETYFKEDTLSIIEEWAKIHQALNHKAFNPESDGYKHFLRQTLLKLKAFNEKYTYICCKEEISGLETKL